MFCRKKSLIFLLSTLLALVGCPKKSSREIEPAPVSLSNVPARKLNYVFDPDVQAPSLKDASLQDEHRNDAIQKDFDENRLLEVLDRTITSPNKQRVLAVYRKMSDRPRQFRLDMYTVDGKLLRNITPDKMAVHFPDTILWSHDSKNVAFISVVRNSGDKNNASIIQSLMPVSEESVDENSNGEYSDATSPKPSKNTLVLLRTEQIYICDYNGNELKPLTQTEGLMYFYFAWAPNSDGLAALALTHTEWQFRKLQAMKKNEKFVPRGRLRFINKKGHERLLDDYPTAIHPVWSPDSAKIAIAFDKQIRIYDAFVNQPTQSAIPLRDELLLSSGKYDEKMKKAKKEASNSEANFKAEETITLEKSEFDNSDSDANVEQPTDSPAASKNLISFNPIIGLKWEFETVLYLQTGYVKKTFIDEKDENRKSFLRWHRLRLSPQPEAARNTDPQQ